MSAEQLNLANPKQVRAQAVKHKAPRCEKCGAHIGLEKVCGACKRLRKRQGIPLTMAELMRFGRLAQKHWYGGRPRDLVRHASYRPNFVVTIPAYMPSIASSVDVKGMISECSERGELADLYDRIQCSRGDARRACRS